MLSLAHRVYIPPALAHEIAVLVGHDLRKVFNSLHFWLAGVAESSQKEEEEHASDLQYVSQSLTSQLLHHLPKFATGNGEWDLAQASPTWMSACLAGPNEEPFLVTNGKEPSAGSAYQELDSCALFSDTVSFLDTISPGPSPRNHFQAQWWKCSLRDSLLDVMAEPEPVSADGKLGDSCRDCLLSVFKLPSLRLPSSMLRGNDGWSHHCQKKWVKHFGLSLAILFIQLFLLLRHAQQVHSAQMQCCEVFQVHNELARTSLATDCLPYLQ